ncbi:hypothetical protein GCM10007160_17290 [Litchfieldella qijiaojingensis]|uniref:Type 4 fimbrial biogenesis protein PilX N-terminal domain-containing protein n=1 Tax=Litchfieldella qijiaojingensis TaxID=980347 RepID=A0ABQ2YPC1_9GAMM|nr:PilX N-terminal domain-containing pilus assembly protein [Halomonas qijiaojingensis]GGX90371.1 hypothetical protein GCM10007160_17290 [Halomonas qijiaojingensis]
MPHPVKKQREKGAALTVVLGLLIVTMLLAISAFQSSQSHERMAGNYRESILALNEAEAGVASFYQAIQQPEVFNFTFLGKTGKDALGALIDAASEATSTINDRIQGVTAIPGEANSTFDTANASWSAGSLNGSPGTYTWEVSAFHPAQVGNAIAPKTPTFWLISKGHYGQEGRQAIRMVKALFTIPESTSHPFDGVMTCEGFTLSGSGIIDSYDSYEGVYSANGNSHGSEIRITSQVQGMPVTLSGSAPIFGNVQVPGDLIATGSSPIIGDIMADGNVDIRGGNWWYEEQRKNGRVFGNIRVGGDIIVNGTAHGNVRSNGRIELNWGSQIEGDAVASEIAFPNNSNPDDFVIGSRQEVSGGAGVAPLPSAPTAAECNTLHVDERVGVFSSVASSGAFSLNGSGRDIVLSANGLHDPNGGPDITVEAKDIDGREVHVVRFDSFSLGGNARFIVGSSAQPVDMIMVIDGKTDIGGDGSFIISEGSTLQIVTSGQFNLTSSITVRDEKPSKRNEEGNTVPILSLVSNHHDAESPVKGQGGVRIGGASAFYGQVIAPYSMVDIHGSDGMYGVINARQVEISSAGGFHYDENFGNLASFGSKNEPGKPQLMLVLEQILQ